MLTGKMLAKSVTAAALSLTMIFTVSMSKVPASASSLSDMQQKQSELKQQEKQIDAELDKLKNDKANKQAYKDKLDAQIKNVENQIDDLNTQIAGLDKDIRAKETQIAGKQKEIDTNFQKLKERLYALYLTGEASNIEIILNAKNIMDLADKAELIQVITEHDTNLINTLKNDINSVKAQKADIEAKKKTVTASKASLDQNQKKLQTLEADVSQVITQLGQNEAQKQTESAKNAAEQKKLDAAIDNWFANYYASQQPQNQGGGSNGGGSNGGGSNGGGSGGYVSKGNFTWPVPSYICISQGYGSYDMGSFHKGIDIAANYGSPIVAADSGRVIWAGYGFSGSGYGGYGNVVVIDHGNGYSSLSAHMSSVAVSAGQQVTKGQTIGYIGSTGDSTGNHCHFEIRRYGSPVNPMAYFG